MTHTYKVKIYIKDFKEMLGRVPNKANKINRHELDLITAGDIEGRV